MSYSSYFYEITFEVFKGHDYKKEKSRSTLLISRLRSSMSRFPGWDNLKCGSLQVQTNRVWKWVPLIRLSILNEKLYYRVVINGWKSEGIRITLHSKSAQVRSKIAE